MILGTVWTVPIYFQTVFAMTPFEASIRLMPTSIAVAASSLLFGAVSNWTGNYRYGLMAALLYPVTQALALTWGRDTPDWQLILDLIPLGLANGGSLNSNYLGAPMDRHLPADSAAIIAAVSDEAQAQVSGISTLSRNFGQVLGVTLAGAVLAGETKSFPPAWRDSYADLPADGRQAYASALHVVFKALLGIAIAAAVCEVSIPRHRLREKRSS